AAVLTEWYFTHQEIAQLIEPITFNETEGIDHIAKGLRHFLAAVEQEAMCENPLRPRNTSRHQECRPIDSVKARDILADDMRIGRPITPLFTRSIRIAKSSNVIGQGVDPDIHDVFLITRHRNAPVECRTRNRQVLQTRLYEAHDVVATSRMHDQ